MFIKVSTADDIEWSDDSKFQGLLVIETVLPDNYTELNLKPTAFTRYMARPLPKRVALPIIDGKLAQTFVIGAASLDPPNVRFKSTWYDAAGKTISGPSDLFEIAGDAPYELSVPTLTVPTAPA